MHVAKTFVTFLLLLPVLAGCFGDPSDMTDPEWPDEGPWRHRVGPAVLSVDFGPGNGSFLLPVAADQSTEIRGQTFLNASGWLSSVGVVYIDDDGQSTILHTSFSRPRYANYRLQDQALGIDEWECYDGTTAPPCEPRGIEAWDARDSSLFNNRSRTLPAGPGYLLLWWNTQINGSIQIRFDGDFQAGQPDWVLGAMVRIIPEFFSAQRMEIRFCGHPDFPGPWCGRVSEAEIPLLQSDHSHLYVLADSSLSPATAMRLCLAGPQTYCGATEWDVGAAEDLWKLVRKAEWRIELDVAAIPYQEEQPIATSAASSFYVNGWAVPFDMPENHPLT